MKKILLLLSLVGIFSYASAVAEAKPKAAPANTAAKPGEAEVKPGVKDAY